MDLRGDERRILGFPRTIAFALAALLIHVLIVVVPWTSGGSDLSVSLSQGSPLRVKVANLLSTFAIGLAIAVGLAISNRGRRAIGAGVFVGVAVVLGLRVLSGILITAGRGWLWQTTVVLALQSLECGLLFVAAGSAHREEPVAAL